MTDEIAKEKTSNTENAGKVESEKLNCGIIMPISALDDYTAEHWAEVKEILLEVIGKTEFKGNLVSFSTGTAIIHETIVQNLYFNEMVICDVSGKNPNVMFELGLRIAFDKPVIVIKDDFTTYSFDTSPIEHLEYPIDLNYKKINQFKEELKDKIEATYEKSKTGSPYLKSFGRIVAAPIESKEVSTDEFILKSLSDLKNEVRNLSNISVYPESALGSLLHRSQITPEKLSQIRKVKFSFDSPDPVRQADLYVDYVSEFFKGDNVLRRNEFGSENNYYLELIFSPPIDPKTFNKITNDAKNTKFNSLGWAITGWG